VIRQLGIGVILPLTALIVGRSVLAGDRGRHDTPFWRNAARARNRAREVVVAGRSKTVPPRHLEAAGGNRRFARYGAGHGCARAVGADCVTPRRSSRSARVNGARSLAWE